MAKYSGDDPYTDPATGVLRNRLSITDAALLDAAEAHFVAERSRELSRTPLEGGFDLAHLQAIHCYLFQDVYEWAGELRTIDIAKGGHLFAHHPYIESTPRRSSGSLRRKSTSPDLALTPSATAPPIILANSTPCIPSAKATAGRSASSSATLR
jgi:cell filamentation protein